MAVYLDFERPIEEIEEQLENARRIEKSSNVDASDTIKSLQEKLHETRKQIYSDLTPWQRVQVSRHPQRPYTLSYIQELTGNDHVEFHGDRNFGDDKAMIGAMGNMGGRSLMFVGQQKGVNTKMRQYRNFGMAQPEGYRKALRLMKLAEKFGKPIVCFIDTPGAFPGIGAEQRGQGEAIARNLYEMIRLKVPVVCVIIGEGASGGALGIGVGDRTLMLENTWYSVISPESCSTILWRSKAYKEKAASSLKLTPEDMKANQLIDGIVEEPVGGAHTDPARTYENVRKELDKHLDKLEQQDPDKRIDRRIRKYSKMGEVER
ncbi:MAG: acetyl-CoA carboxylase carboxyltransferase subunit alpha [Flavobacteriales bacterium]